MTELLEPDWLVAGGADGFVTGLRGYVDRVAAALGVGPESCAIDPQPPVSAYVALDVRLPHQPERDVALLWDQRHGWSACVETHSGEDLIVVAYHGPDLLPAPAAIEAFLHALAAGRPAGRPDPPTPARYELDTLADRLAGTGR
jgi:uncharacterized protein DUF6292